jgi:hypothetical protein
MSQRALLSSEGAQKQEGVHAAWGVLPLKSFYGGKAPEAYLAGGKRNFECYGELKSASFCAFRNASFFDALPPEAFGPEGVQAGREGQAGSPVGSTRIGAEAAGAAGRTPATRASQRRRRRKSIDKRL